jgi:hypothetical protein
MEQYLPWLQHWAQIPDSFIGKKVRNHWEKGNISYNAYVEVYGSDEPSPHKSKETSYDK